MQVETKTIEIENNGELSAEYIENKISAMGIRPLRWAIVKISKKMFTIDVAYDRISS